MELLVIERQQNAGCLVNYHSNQEKVPVILGVDNNIKLLLFDCGGLATSGYR